MVEYLQEMARYNQWVNRKLFAKVAELPADAISEDRDAFFGSILGTLNHILIADLIWLHRFATHPDCREALAHRLAEYPTPARLNEILFEDFSVLADTRRSLDTLIIKFSKGLNDALLQSRLHYRNMRGEEHEQPLALLMQHFFNHQTHHRGQATTLLFQAGIDPGVTDLVAMETEPQTS